MSEAALRRKGGLDVRFVLVQLPTMGTPCKVWMGARNDRGYGQIWIPGAKRVDYVHRVAWVEANGSVPPGLDILHACDNPPCYELGHLSVGTPVDNGVDMVSKGRCRNSQKTHCPSGHPYDGTNTFLVINRGGHPSRRCRLCAREHNRRTTARAVARRQEVGHL